MNNDNDNFTLDKARVRAAFDRAAPRYDDAAVLQSEVRARLLERLDLVKIQPQIILDIGAGTGHGTAALMQRYKKADVIAVDVAHGMLLQTRHKNSSWRPWQKTPALACGDAESLPFADACADMIFSNLTLQWCNDLDRTFKEFRRVLKPGGLLMFTTFGPDTLKELRQSWSSVDGFNHVNVFIDMHDIGDAMMRARLAIPVVMDAENFTLTYATVQHLMRDLKTIGAHNVTAGRARGLTGKGRMQAVYAAYENYRREGVLPATYEIVYGHAWAPEQSATAQTTREPGVFKVEFSPRRDAQERSPRRVPQELLPRRQVSDS